MYAHACNAPHSHSLHVLHCIHTSIHTNQQAGTVMYYAKNFIHRHSLTLSLSLSLFPPSCLFSLSLIHKILTCTDDTNACSTWCVYAFVSILTHHTSNYNHTHGHTIRNIMVITTLISCHHPKWSQTHKPQRLIRLTGTKRQVVPCLLSAGTGNNCCIRTTREQATLASCMLLALRLLDKINNFWEKTS